MEKRCKSCRYRRAISTKGTAPACNYLLDTGKLRGCSPQNCDKWEARSRKTKPKPPVDCFGSDMADVEV